MVLMWSDAISSCSVRKSCSVAFGGFDPNYYQKQHASRTSFDCNQINQVRDGFTVGFQTCSVILFNSDSPTYGHCNLGSFQDVFKQYQGAVCKLFTTYLTSIKSNQKNVGFAFWTYTTGIGERRIQQWDFSWAVSQKMINDTINPIPVDMCDSINSN